MKTLCLLSVLFLSSLAIGQDYKYPRTVPSIDGCNSCTYSEPGFATCTLMTCPPKTPTFNPLTGWEINPTHKSPIFHVQSDPPIVFVENDVTIYIHDACTIYSDGTITLGNAATQDECMRELVSDLQKVLDRQWEVQKQLKMCMDEIGKFGEALKAPKHAPKKRGGR